MAAIRQNRQMFASSYRERMAAAICSFGAVALIGYVLLYGLIVPSRIYADNPLILLDLKQPPPPGRIAAPPEPKKKKTSLKRERASAPNRKALASPIVAPPILPLVPSPVIAAPMPNIGSAAANGASEISGPGQGAGGVGNGFGGGGDGDGGQTPARQIRGKLSFDDMPGSLRVAGVERIAVVRYHVNIDGHVNGCVVTTSTGNSEFDDIICQLIERRFRFKPARDGNGKAVPSVVKEDYSWLLIPSKAGQGDVR